MIEAVVFDLDQTLSDSKTAEQGARRKVCTDLGRQNSLDPEDIHAIYVEEFRPRLMEWAAGNYWRSHTGLEFRTVLWEKVLRRLGLDPWQAGTLAETQEGLRRESLSLFPDARPVLARLHGKYRLGLISNGARDMQRATANALNVIDFFKVLFFEGEFGHGKPDTRIFAAAAAGLNVPGEKIIMIGDNLFTDVAGARRSGWHAAWLNRHRQPLPAEVPVAERPHMILRSLWDLPLPELNSGRELTLLPAIDLQAGRAVRLRQGRAADKTDYGDPIIAARRWLEAGAAYLHVVDLDGAFAGRPQNRAAIAGIVDEADNAGVPVQLGGGLRSLEAIAAALELGVTRVIIGTKALDGDLMRDAIARFGAQRVVAGIDARAGRVATDGWVNLTELSAVGLAARLRGAGVQICVYTDISKDGMLAGPNWEGLSEMAGTGLQVIASGGISTLEDVRRLCGVPGVVGAILGKALYSGALDLGGAIEATREETGSRGPSKANHPMP